MSTVINQRLKDTYPDDGLRDFVRTKAVKAAAKKQVYYSLLFRENNITDYSQYRPIDITRKIKELWDIKGEDYVPEDEEYNKIIYLNDKQKKTLIKNYEKEKEKNDMRERVKEEKKIKKEEEQKEKKPRGRPKKETVVLESTVIEAEEQNKIETSTIVEKVEIETEQTMINNNEIKPKKMTKTEKQAEKEAEKEAKKKAKEDAKKQKEQAKEAAKAEKLAAKAAAKAEKEANKKKPGRPRKETNVYVSDSDDNKEKQTTDVVDEENNDEYLEEEVTVKIIEVDGKMYYYDSNDVLYDINTHEELGHISELIPGYEKKEK